MANNDGRQRVIVESVYPEVDAGRFPIKRTVGETVTVEADAFTDSHDAIACVLLYRKTGAARWQETHMTALPNDRWRGTFSVDELGCYEYSVLAWVDPFASWRKDFVKRVQREDIALALHSGAELVAQAAERASGDDARHFKVLAETLRGDLRLEQRRKLALDDDLVEQMALYPDRRFASRYERNLPVTVDDERARFSAWYEFFPRSCGPGTRHGTFKEAEDFLPRIADMGFDVVYFPPIHPIGKINRKGRNNTLHPQPSDSGVPWAIGSAEGGHKAIHPQLGTLDDFRRLIARARILGIEIALDIAFQCAPDHPWVTEHPAWFRWRPDGTVQFAENPPKKYQDIYPLNFESDDWENLWRELKSVFEYWIEQGVRIFRVDNPHTKALPFWEWCIAELKAQRPDLIFLSEAFTRPKIMHRLAKLGYTQSYTYFAWRNSKAELTDYLTELTKAPSREYFRPNFWPNTPDILTEYLQFGAKPAFVSRLVLAATLTANYGIYGPAYEICDNAPREAGSEEYLDSEKYEIKDWPLDRPDSLKDLITCVNQIRHANPALQYNWSLRFHKIDNDQIIVYSKATADFANVILIVVNLDYTYNQAGWTDLDLAALGVEAQQPFEVCDLLSDTRYLWSGPRNYVELNPQRLSAHIFRVRARIHTEHDFETFMG